MQRLRDGTQRIRDGMVYINSFVTEWCFGKGLGDPAIDALSDLIRGRDLIDSGLAKLDRLEAWPDSHVEPLPQGVDERTRKLMGILEEQSNASKERQSA